MGVSRHTTPIPPTLATLVPTPPPELHPTPNSIIPKPPPLPTKAPPLPPKAPPLPPTDFLENKICLIPKKPSVTTVETTSRPGLDWKELTNKFDKSGCPKLKAVPEDCRSDWIGKTKPSYNKRGAVASNLKLYTEFHSKNISKKH